jgi:hypothetical protein
MIERTTAETKQPNTSFFYHQPSAFNRSIVILLGNKGIDSIHLLLFIESQSFLHEFFIFLHIALEDVLNWSQESFELIASNRQQLTFRHCLDAGLPHCVFYQRYLSEVFAFFVLVDHILYFCFQIQFFCQQIAFHHEI